MIGNLKPLLIAMVSLFAPLLSQAQRETDIIFFYAPYTGDTKTNQYKIPTTKFDFNTQYHNLKKANAKDELAFAIKHDDYGFLAISGNAYLFPGLEKLKSKEVYLKKYKYKVIDGTSDAVDSSKPILQTVAYDFAKSYNKLLLIKLQEMEKAHSK